MVGKLRLASHLRLFGLLRNTSDRITELAQDTAKTLKDSADFQFFSLACDETTDITKTAHLAVFVRGITAELDTQEELLSPEATRGATTGEGLLRDLF
ncbi:hypothetical protein QTO34_016824 [Cnephaeus nilssonii]|uniref:Uncharacterized protein n=1 Tax=Cnephaeus nilssonii TaxID=3371016 RepID=A0AA40I2Y5_CNENI|nr:hypothetical protein QTO34_016824 [Eptesicus nilssonii]